MDVYPIYPGERLQRRIIEILTADLLPLPPFNGMVINSDRNAAEVTLPFITVAITQAEEVPPTSNWWHIQIIIALVEDRPQAGEAMGSGPQTRHEAIAENLTARLFGVWNGASLMDAINATAGVSVQKIYARNLATGSIGEDAESLLTEIGFTCLCVANSQ
jgi:hypothetical protein